MRSDLCLGFLFNYSGSKVALINKKRPAWQAGKLNGIGGKINPWETSLEAQIREFEEETFFEFTDWEKIGSALFGSSKMDIFRGFLLDNEVPRLFPEIREGGEVGEIPEWISVQEIGNEIPRSRFIGNIDWMVKFCLDTRGCKQSIEINYAQ